MLRKLLTALLIVGNLLLSVQATPVAAAPSKIPPHAPATQSDEVAFQARAAELVRAAACSREDEFNREMTSASLSRSENLMAFLVAKVRMIELGGCIPVAMDLAGDCAVGQTSFCLERQINNAILAMNSNDFQLGTDGIPCLTGDSKPGDYDFALRGLISVADRFPPSSTGFGLSTDAYHHLRDNLLIVHGLSPHDAIDDYDYHLSACGNKEHRTRTPGEHVAGFEAVKNLCESMGISAAECNKLAAQAPDADEGCFSSLLCTLAILLVLLLLPALGAALGGAAAAGAGAGTSTGIAGVAGAAAGGAAIPAAVAIGTTNIPETENHILMIETARFLSNNLKQRDYECADPALSPQVCTTDSYIGASDLFNNSKNGQAEWILSALQHLLSEDFDEYNSRPYARKSITAVEVLYDLACALENPCTGDNLRVKVAARAVLDYLSAKYVVSSSTLKRYVPFRRQTKYKPEGDITFGGSPDFETWRFAMLLGTNDIPTYTAGGVWCERTDNNGFCPDVINRGWVAMIFAAVGEYRLLPQLEWIAETQPTIPDNDHSLGESNGCADYWQRFLHDTEEIYFCDRSFTLSAGGVETGPALTVLGFGEDNDHGVAYSTTLLPHGVGVDRKEFIRFEGVLNADEGEEDVEARYLNNSPNLCVDRNFACGLNLVVPPAYQHDACHDQVGSWQFIDATRCPGIEADFYVAAYTRFCDCDAGAPNTFGVMEVVDARVGSFDAFKSAVLLENDAASTLWEEDEENEYRRVDGTSVFFEPEEARIVTDYNDDLLAQGDVVWADRTGCVVITNPAVNQQVLISLRDTHNPFIVLLVDPFSEESADAFCNGGGDYRESYWVNH